MTAVAGGSLGSGWAGGPERRREPITRRKRTASRDELRVPGEKRTAKPGGGCCVERVDSTQAPVDPQQLGLLEKSIGERLAMESRALGHLRARGLRSRGISETTRESAQRLEHDVRGPGQREGALCSRSEDRNAVVVERIGRIEGRHPEVGIEGQHWSAALQPSAVGSEDLGGSWLPW